MSGTGQGYAVETDSPSWDNKPYRETDGRPEIHSVIADSEGNKGVIDEGGALKVSMDDLFGIFTDVLKELKKMNFHLMLMTDTTITNKDVEV